MQERSNHNQSTEPFLQLLGVLKSVFYDKKPFAVERLNLPLTIGEMKVESKLPALITK